jgi:hypothetical protein
MIADCDYAKRKSMAQRGTIADRGLRIADWVSDSVKRVQCSPGCVFTQAMSFHSTPLSLNPQWSPLHHGFPARR